MNNDNEFVVDGEFTVTQVPTIDNLSKVQWRMKTGVLIKIGDMADSHLRNCALFLMGMGYQTCIADEWKRVVWLRIMKMEWERRMLRRMHQPENKRFQVNVRDYSLPRLEE